MKLYHVPSAAAIVWHASPVLGIFSVDKFLDDLGFAPSTTGASPHLPAPTRRARELVMTEECATEPMDDAVIIAAWDATISNCMSETRYQADPVSQVHIEDYSACDFSTFAAACDANDNYQLTSTPDYVMNCTITLEHTETGEEVNRTVISYYYNLTADCASLSCPFPFTAEDLATSTEMAAAAQNKTMECTAEFLDSGIEDNGGNKHGKSSKEDAKPNSKAGKSSKKGRSIQMSTSHAASKARKSSKKGKSVKMSAP